LRDGQGRIASVDIADGRRRTVSFANTPEGQILNRKERSEASTNQRWRLLFAADHQRLDLE
jgi:hypothetical protein